MVGSDGNIEFGDLAQRLERSTAGLSVGWLSRTSPYSQAEIDRVRLVILEHDCWPYGRPSLSDELVEFLTTSSMPAPFFSLSAETALTQMELPGPRSWAELFSGYWYPFAQEQRNHYHVVLGDDPTEPTPVVMVESSGLTTSCPFPSLRTMFAAFTLFIEAALERFGIALSEADDDELWSLAFWHGIGLEPNFKGSSPRVRELFSDLVEQFDEIRKSIDPPPHWPGPMGASDPIEPENAAVLRVW